MIVEVKEISKRYGTTEVLRGFSMQLRNGEVVALLGENGAGKSTLMRIITGNLLPDAGDVLIGGYSILQESTNAKRALGYLPEAASLYGECYAREYLQMVADLHGMRHAQERIDYLMEVLGLNEQRRKRIGQLSKGYKQRVGIAQAFLHQPQLVILDEPFNGLDRKQQIAIRSFVKQEAQQCAILFSTHIMEEVDALADRVIEITRTNTTEG